MKMLVIGSGGREHAMCWKLAQSPALSKLFCAPGNAGIAEVAECVPHKNFEDIASFCKSEAIDLVMVGPEAPLVEGITDYLKAKNITVFGPSKAASILEGSKGFVKDLCKAKNIPTAAYQRFNNAEAAKQYVEAQGAPIVVKADGLAAGKGVIIAQTTEEALEAIDEIFAGKFGEAGKEVVVEAFLEGEEASLFALCDGKNALLLGSAQDHKRVGESDTGPNTGGMGTYSPTPVMDEAMNQKIMREFIQPTLDYMVEKDMPFQGILFAGIIITQDGPQLLEYNIRFGDPEAQVLLPRLETDLAELIAAAANGKLEEVPITLSDRTALCVVMASNGYPGAYKKGSEINNVDAANALPDTIVFHAGTKQEGEKLLSYGGRVLGVTALGNSVKEAQEKAYKAVDTINWPEGFCRLDIGWRAIAT